MDHFAADGGNHQVAIVGASGFIGSRVAARFAQSGWQVRAVKAPRVAAVDADPDAIRREALDICRQDPRVVEDLRGVGAVINAAGIANSAECGASVLWGANAMLPLIIQMAAREAGAKRYIHLSSAAVQGYAERWDETRTYAPFSPYSESKAVGEAVLELNDWTCIYRPTSVHGPERTTTQALIRLARSPAASVRAPGGRPTPQIVVDDVASAVLFLSEYPAALPPIVLHPPSGLTTEKLLTLLGGRPKQVPPWLADRILGVLKHASGARMSARARQLDLLWNGQLQTDGWLRSAGWTSETNDQDWVRLAAATEKMMKDFR